MIELLKMLTGMRGLTDQVIATDFLISAKSGVINTSLALTESATPELRAELEKQLFEAIDTHEAISDYMISRGYYLPHQLGEQLSNDLQIGEISLNLADSKREQ